MTVTAWIFELAPWACQDFWTCSYAVSPTLHKFHLITGKSNQISPSQRRLSLLLMPQWQFTTGISHLTDTFHSMYTLYKMLPPFILDPIICCCGVFFLKHSSPPEEKDYYFFTRDFIYWRFVFCFCFCPLLRVCFYWFWRKMKGEREIEKHLLVTSHSHSYWGANLQQRYVPWLELNLQLCGVWENALINRIFWPEFFIDLLFCQLNPSIRIWASWSQFLIMSISISPFFEKFLICTLLKII